MRDVEKLAKFMEKSRELHELSKKTGIGKTAAFTHLEIDIQQDTIIRERLYNDGNRVTLTYEFPFSMIDHFMELKEKKINYRKKQLDEND